MTTAEKTNWPRALPFLLAAWLYLPAVLLVVHTIGNRISENVLGLIFAALSLLALAPFVAYLNRWLTTRAFMLLYLLPAGLAIVLLALVTSD